jgi:inositol phosphorylceramide mannosyltransferase catalytic subunit
MPTESFRTMMRYSKYHPQESPWDYDWSLVENLYYKNYILAKLYGNLPDVIPKKIHQIWLGGELPERYRQFTLSWQRFHPDWEYKLWNDKDAEEFGMERIDAYRSSSNFGTRSDIFSYEILRRYGGLYVDCDFECIKPFDDLLFLDYFTSVAYDSKLEIYHGLMASVHEHPIVISCVKDIVPYNGEDGNLIMQGTGPYHLTRCFLKNVDSETKGVVAFPCQFFYCWPNYDRFNKKPYESIQPESFAIHHWTVSWLK